MSLSGASPKVMPFGKIEVCSNGSRHEEDGLEERFQVRDIVNINLKSPPIYPVKNISH